MIHNEQEFLEHVSATTREQAERNIYKYNDCGPWIKWHDNGVELGSIVEGSDVDITTTPLTYPFTEDDYDQTMQYVNDEASMEWDIANLNDDDDDT